MPTQEPRTGGQRSATSQHGSIVVYLVLALVAFGVLAMAGASRLGSVARGVLSPNCSAAARYMAESGVRYAMTRLRSASDKTTLTTLVNEMNAHGAYTVDASKGLSFTLSITYSGGQTATVTSTGKSCTGLGNFFGSTTSAQPSVVNLPNLPDVIDFTNIGDDFFTTTDLRGTSPISVDAATKTISFGNLSETKEAAAIWYGGNTTSGCVDGNCTMTNGFNAYFDVVWNSASIADGLVFGAMSAETNTRNAVGGTTTQGELMGWAGPGASGLGIRPPKMGLEFDTFYNSCGSNLTSPGSRCDPTGTGNNPDHMAYVFWGSTSTLYDDNRHGAGNGGITEPVASNDPDSSGSGQFGVYYKSATPAWLQGGTKYYVRHELTRLTTKSSAATDRYCYVLKSWVSSTAPSAAYKDVSADYDAVAYPPTMQQVVFLNADYHAKMNKIFFGWTEATGDYTQNITVGNFNLAFKKAQPTYGTAPSGATLYWPMYDNLGSSISDASGNAITGTISGTAMWVPGIMNNNGAGLYFDGSTYAYAANASGLQLTTAGGVSLWFKMTSSQTNVWLLHKGETGRTSECYGMYIDGSGYLRFRLRYNTGNTQYVEVVSTTKPTAGTWCHVAATWDASNALAIYVNGVKQANLSTIYTARNTSTNLYLGAASASSTEFAGIIDEVYLYKQLLTQANITALATGKP